MQISHLACLADDTALKARVDETQQQATLPSSALISPVVVKTSPPPLLPSRLAARDGKSEPPRPETPESPALSTTSTAECDSEYSPVLPPLPAPVLPGRASEFLRTPPNELEDDDQYITASWGSPYPDTHRDHLRVESFSSETSEESPIHQLDIHTPFLRPPPELTRDLAEQSNYAFVSASVLANRARRQTGGLTEDWIRQHTASDLAEGHLWLSDGAEEDEPSSLSGSDVGWLEPHDIVTPRADSNRFHLPGESRRYSRTRSGVETLTPEALARMIGSPVADSKMTSLDYLQPSASEVADDTSAPPTENLAKPGPPEESSATPAPEVKIPNAPSSVSSSRMKVNSRVHVQRPKKKVPWKGKNILVLLPLDHERGQPGKAPLPLNQNEIEKMWSSWDELGYNTRGFDLNHDNSRNECQSSQSRAFWPSHAEMERDHRDRKFTITLPDLNAWKNYVDELNEAKLRALGVSSHDDEPIELPSVSPVPSGASRIPSSQLPGQPFSPPMPPSSASSNPFPFANAPFVPGGRSSSVTSPGTHPTTSPFGLPGKYNSRQSISIPASSSPFQFPAQSSPQNWAQQSMYMQGASRGESPLSMSGLVSPSSPYQQAGSPGFNMHQRHQSLQYPMLPHQQMPHFSPRDTPVLHELKEVEEEAPSKSPSTTPEASKRNPDGLQAEIDDAEYHLEEQLRHELEHEDYSPHHEDDTGGGAFQMADSDYFPTSHGRHQSVQFALPEQVASNSGPGPVLHHPRPHSRGQSLGHGFFMNRDEAQANGDVNGGFGRFKLPAESGAPRPDDVEEIQTNPSNLGTPVQDFELASILQQDTHQRAFSTTSNPWEDVTPASQTPASRRMSHGSKASLSKLNVEAPEFKFNPQSTFKPGQFVFGGNAFQPQPTILQTNPLAQPLSPSATSSQFSMSTGSKINASAPAFSPGRSDFSFSASGPKFRPDAPAFTPLGGTPSVATTSPLVGSKTPMFDSIDIPAPGILMPSKKSTAVPISRPSSRDSSSTRSTNAHEDLDGHPTDDTRVKRARASPGADDDAVPLFAEPSDTARDLSASQAAAGLETVSDQRSGDEGAEMADTSMSMSSMLTSEVTDAKPTAPTSTSSQSETSPQWGAFEFNSQADMQSFHHALPVGENEPFRKGHHKKSLSAAAKPFTPGSFLFGDVETELPDDEQLDDDAKDAPAVETDSLDVTDAESKALEQEALSADANEFEPKAFSPSAKAFTPMSSYPTAPDFKPQNMEQEVEDEAPQSAEESVDEPVDEPESTTPLQATVLHLVPQGSPVSRPASPPPKPKGLAASRFAASPSPEPEIEESSPVSSKDAEWEPESVVRQLSPTPDLYDDEAAEEAHESDAEHVATDGDEYHTVEKTAEALGTTEPTFEEIDAVMRHINENDPLRGVVNYRADSPQFHQPSPTRQLPLPFVPNGIPFHLPPTQHFRSDAPSPSPRRYQALPGEPAQPIMSTELDDPFVDAHMSDNSYTGIIQRLNVTEALPVSDWDKDFSDGEQIKLEHRVQFFDGHVNDVVSTVLTSRLDPVERTLDSIQRALSKLSGRGVSAHRRSTSRENDADDEDDEEPGAQRSMSPQRSRRVDQIRTAVLEALSSHERAALPPVVAADPSTPQDNLPVLRALEELKEQFGTNLRLDFRGEDLRNIVEEAVERRMPQTPQPDEDTNTKLGEMHARVIDLEQRLHSEQARAEKEIADRRATQDAMAELQRKLDAAEAQVEIQIRNRSTLDGRVGDLEQTLANEKHTLEAEVNGRRAAEDRLSEVQRLLRISTEEETRLRETLDQRDQRVRSLEQATSKTTMRLTLLDAAQANATQSQSELTNRISAADSDLNGAKQEVNHWRLEAERATEGLRRMESDLTEALNEKKHLHKLLDTLGTQLEENERVRDTWRTKFMAFQDDMARASAQITEENARRTKKEQALIARQEVLDARLQAEARTRERLETEIERLEGGERQGMRAVSESKRLEALLSDLRGENHKVHQAAMRYQREFEDAREAGAGEVQRVRIAMQAQLDGANNQVNVVRADLEEQIAKLRSDLDHAKIDVGSAKAQSEMLLEEAQATKDAEFQQLDAKYSNDMEDMQTRHDRQLNTAVDEAQTREQRLLERLSISTSRTEHLQDRVIHLEEKLEIAKEAAHAAARAAKSSSSSPEFVLSPSAMQPTRSVQAMDLPEKVSPQALRESIMVLQEQLQEREQRIEELQHTVDDMDPDAPAKIAKRDDEIIWLRELLAVRHSDLQDIIGALSPESYDKDRVRDAVIRLQANLQMEEQERERAMNGGSSVRLPNIAQTIRVAATPRVAQAVGPIAAAWGSWRKAQPSFGSFSGVLSSPATASARNHTPSKASTLSQNNKAVGGLMTPPTPTVRQAAPTAYPPAQPTAFTASSRRFTGQRGEHSGRSSISSRRAEKLPAVTTPPRHAEHAQPVTPPMMEQSGYDSDANPGDFDDHGFFVDD